MSGRSKKVARIGRDLIGNAAAGVVSAATDGLAPGLGGPALQAIAGTAAGGTIKTLCEELLSRMLSKGEKKRLASVAELAAEEIMERRDRGETIREDWFLSDDDATRADGEEVLERVLLTSQREPERRKLPYMAHLFAGLAFEPAINAEYAHQIVRVAEQLTYRQTCLLRLAASKETFNLRDNDYRGHGSFDVALLQLLYECEDLYRKSLVNFGGEVVFGPSDVRPGRMTVQGMGGAIYQLMRLNEIASDDLHPIARQLA